MRDRRLLMAMLLFLAALIAGLIQTWIVHLYIVAAVMGGQAYWDHFVDLFGLDPVTVPGQICFDYCAPDLPFVAGWIGIAAFLAGWIILGFAWWKSKR